MVQTYSEKILADGRDSRKYSDVVVTVGFPCQDISIAGKGYGLDGERSGLWWEAYRIICELLPRFIIVENTAELLNRGLGEILGAMAEIGYDAEWDCFPTGFNFGHRRERVFIVAYPVCERLSKRGNTNQNGINEKSIFTRERFAGVFESINPGQKWADRPLLGRGISRIPYRVDRLKGLGNAIVPQVAQIIMQAIKEIQESQRT